VASAPTPFGELRANEEVAARLEKLTGLGITFGQSFMFVPEDVFARALASGVAELHHRVDVARRVLAARPDPEPDPVVDPFTADLQDLALRVERFVASYGNRVPDALLKANLEMVKFRPKPRASGRPREWDQAEAYALALCLPTALADKPARALTSEEAAAVVKIFAGKELEGISLEALEDRLRKNLERKAAETGQGTKP
jgi:hypothetical protein